MTLLWFFVWLIANLIGDEEGLTFDPVNFWAGWLLLALALGPRRRARQAGLEGRTLDRIRDALHREGGPNGPVRYRTKRY